jgi:PAS domain S-box-containing protein
MSADKIEMRSRSQLLEEIEELRTRLDEAEQTLQAIRSGDVDALIVEGPQGDQIFSLAGVESVYRVIIETMNEAALTVSPQGAILFCNRRFADLMKTPMRAVIGRELSDFVEVPHHPALVELITQAQMEPTRGRLMLRSADGTLVPGQFSASLLDSGTIPCICLVASDLTELEASTDLVRFLREHQQELEGSQRALRESESLYRELVQSANSAIIRWACDGTIIFFNEYAQKFFGWSAEEVAGKHITMLLPERDSTGADLTGLVRDIVAHPARYLSNINENVCRDGRRVWMTWTNRALRDERGLVQEILAIGSDVTESKRDQEALKLSELRFRALTEKSGELITVLDSSGIITYNLASAQSTLGYSPEELVGRSAFELVHPDDLPRVANLFQEGVPQPGKVEQAEFRLRAKDGSWRWQLAVGTNLLHEPAVGGILINSRDITERKRDEDAVRAAKEKLEERVQERTAELNMRVEQLARLASQLTMTEQRERNRLAQVLHDGLQQYLLATKLQVGELVERATDVALKQSANEVEKLLSESIRVSRTLAAELSPRSLHETGLMAGLEWLSRWMFDKHGLKTELVLQTETPVLAEDVKLLLFESIRELLLNVVKHARTRSAMVSLALEDGRSFKVVISDKGVGFAPASAVENKDSFGLFCIRERVNLIGGSFEVESSPGKGASLTLRTPMVVNQPLAPMPDAQPVEVRPTGLSCFATSVGKIRIMLTDDHPAMREGLARLLAQETDFEIVGQASDGQEAVEFAAKLVPDVILMDISMPRMNGLDATRIIHQHHPDIRIIGLSLYQEEERAKAMLDSGAVYYLSKTSPPSDLKAAIRSCMHKKSQAETENAESLPLKI